MSNETNLYAPPTADVVGAGSIAAADSDAEFFTVSTKKLWVMSMVTLGIYAFYWFYKNWKLQMQKTGEKIMPFWRAVFSIFFTHELFRRVDARLKSNPDAAVDWDSRAMATAVVTLSVVSYVFDRVTGRMDLGVVVELVSLALLPLQIALLAKVQVIVNHANGDPQGSGNSRFTALNVVGIILGVVIWLMIAAAYALPDKAAF